MSEHPEPKQPKLPSKAALAMLDTLEADIERDHDEWQKAQRSKRQAHVEKNKIHPEAFALMRKLKSQDVAVRTEFLRHFLHYVEAFDLDKQLDLFDVPVAEQVAAMAQAGAREGLGLSRGST